MLIFPSSVSQSETQRATVRPGEGVAAHVESGQAKLIQTISGQFNSI